MNHMYNLDRLLTLETAAEKLKISLRTVRSWIYRRAIPFTRLGRRIYLDLDVVEEILNRNAICALQQSSPGSKPMGQGGAEKERGDK